MKNTIKALLLLCIIAPYQAIYCKSYAISEDPIIKRYPFKNFSREITDYKPKPMTIDENSNPVEAEDDII